MDQLVNEHVVSRLDHRFLNHEVDPFRELNPTVEHIAETIWQWLDGVFAPHRLRTDSPLRDGQDLGGYWSDE